MDVAQSGRAYTLEAEGRRFESCYPYHLLREVLETVEVHNLYLEGSIPSPAPIFYRSSSMAELSDDNRIVVGSSPTCGTT